MPASGGLRHRGGSRRARRGDTHRGGGRQRRRTSAAVTAGRVRDEGNFLAAARLLYPTVALTSAPRATTHSLPAPASRAATCSGTGDSSWATIRFADLPYRSHRELRHTPASLLPAYVVTAGRDPLCDEGVLCTATAPGSTAHDEFGIAAARLSAAGEVQRRSMPRLFA